MSSKQHSRRTLLKSLAAGTVAVGMGVGLSGAAGAAPAAKAAAAVPGGGRSRLVPVNRIGIQLFSVRGEISARGFGAVLPELADIGYTQIEFAGYTQPAAIGTITPAQIRTILDDNGLEAAGSHVGLTPANIDAEIEKALTLGLKHMGSGGAITRDNTEAGWLAAVDTWNTLGEKAKAAGIQLYMHNHAGEFAYTTDTNKRIYDLVWDRMNPEVLAFQMDVYWAHVGAHLYPGFKPIDYVLKDPRRYPLLHLKDGKRNQASANGYDIIEFGAGNIDYAAFLGATRDRGGRLGLWEQDNAATVAAPPNPVGAMGNARRSYNAIAALRG